MFQLRGSDYTVHISVYVLHGGHLTGSCIREVTASNHCSTFTEKTIKIFMFKKQCIHSDFVLHSIQMSLVYRTNAGSMQTVDWIYCSSVRMS